MEKQELELIQSMVKLTHQMQTDRMEERKLSDNKNKRQMIISIVLIVAFTLMWSYEIHESYDCSEFEIRNEASATIENKRGDK
jgi:hypothetical protein